MTFPGLSERVPLFEQLPSPTFLSEEEAAFLSGLRFDVIPLRSATEAPDDIHGCLYAVNPHQYVGHFLLPGGRAVTVQPKVGCANVFRMLAYIYCRFSRQFFRDEEVHYEKDSLLFAPLVELFNRLVENRARRGLFQEYVSHEENLGVLRGSVLLRQHLNTNHSRPDRIFCRYWENTVDNQDNQIIKWTLYHLLRIHPWTVRTSQLLRANLQQFSAVSLRFPETGVLDRRHYHRLNDDYRPLHDLCRLFLSGMAISEKPGDFSFRGFLLNMNQLFEDFITQAFLAVAARTRYSADPQKSDLLSPYPVQIKPDVTLRLSGEAVAVVDAKYKRAVDHYENHDFYQMLAYGTALRCNQTYLFYPTTEVANEGLVEVKNSSVTIAIRQVDLADKNCVHLAEEAAWRILKEVQQTGGRPIAA